MPVDTDSSEADIVEGVLEVKGYNLGMRREYLSRKQKRNRLTSLRVFAFGSSQYSDFFGPGASQVLMTGRFGS